MNYNVILFILLTSLFATGCSSMHKINLDNEHHWSVNNVSSGDYLKITTQDGKTIEMEVKSLSEKTIIGDDITIPFNQIKSLEKREISVLKTAGLSLGIYSALAIVGSILFVAAI